MKNLIKFIIAASFLTISCGTPKNDDLKTDGIFATKEIEESFFLHMSDSNVFSFQQYIEKHGKIQNNTISSLDMATAILYTAYEFEVDPRILLALIRKESAFQQDAISPTGAAGLSQFTEIAIAEVQMQLGLKGPNCTPDDPKPENRCARAETIEYWKTKIPQVYMDLTGNNWQHPQNNWSTSQTKDLLKSDPVRAIIYAVVLLKTDLAWKSQVNPTADIDKIFELALKQYNGDPNVNVQIDYYEKITKWAREYSN